MIYRECFEIIHNLDKQISAISIAHMIKKQLKESFNNNTNITVRKIKHGPHTVASLRRFPR